MDIITILLIVLLLWFVFESLPLIIGLIAIIVLYILLSRNRRL